jgi:HlyD family secretion protein
MASQTAGQAKVSMSVRRRIALAGGVLLAGAAVLGATAWWPLFGFSVRSWFTGGFVYAGTIEATKVDVPARVSTVIGTISVQEGDTVREGQVLAQLAGEDVKINEELLDSYYARADWMVRQGELSLPNYESLKASRKLAKLQKEWLTVKAPVSGTVLTRYHEPGEQVMAGTRLFTVANLESVWVYIYVPQPLLYRIRPGMKVEGSLPELRGRTFAGTVLKLNDEAEFTPKNVQTREERTRLVFGIKIGFDNADGILKPGMPIEMRLPE